MALIIIKQIFLRHNLIWELTLKDLKIRYRRPILGFFWAILLPLLTTLIFFVIFSLLLKVQIEGAPFVLYVMIATFSWAFFQSSISSSVTGLVDNKNLIKESNFPHYLVTVSIVLANFINFLPALLIFLAVSIYVLKGVSFYIFLLPFILIIHLIITSGLAMIVSILYVKWRDTKYILEAALLLLFYFTPVFYPLSLIKNILPGFLYTIYTYNPFVSILCLYRIVLLKDFYLTINCDINLFLSVISSLVSAFLIFLLGTFLYNKNKEIINDHLFY